MSNKVYACIKLTRNIKGYPFCERMNDAQKKEVRDKIKTAFFDACKDGWEYIDMENADRIYSMSLAERRIISGEFLNGRQGRAVILNGDKTAAVIINGADHIKINVMLPGGDIDKALEIAKETEEKLASLGYAYSEKLGYLTCGVSEIGTGMKASFILHLPAMTDSGAMGEMFERVDRIGLSLRGIDTENRDNGALYRLTSRVTLGVTENDTLTKLTDIANRIEKREESLLKRISENEGILLEDKIMRAYGTLKYARVISSREASSLYSLVRAGMECGIIEDDPTALDGAYFTCRPATLAIECGENNSSAQRDRLRAEKLKASLK